MFYSFNRYVCRQSAVHTLFSSSDDRIVLTTAPVFTGVTYQRAKNKKQPTHDTWDRFITGTIFWSDCHSVWLYAVAYYLRSVGKEGRGIVGSSSSVNNSFIFLQYIMIIVGGWVIFINTHHLFTTSTKQ